MNANTQIKFIRAKHVLYLELSIKMNYEQKTLLKNNSTLLSASS